MYFFLYILLHFCASLTSRSISYLALDMLIYFAQLVLYLNTLKYQINCKFCEASNTSLITQKKCTIFIHYIYLLCVCYMFRSYIHHYQGEIMCPLLQTTCFHAAIHFVIIECSSVEVGWRTHQGQGRRFYINCTNVLPADDVYITPKHVGEAQ